ncbi:hypothetical protein ABPG74_001504 [Tetrahymena malaccensis]
MNKRQKRISQAEVCNLDSKNRLKIDQKHKILIKYSMQYLCIGELKNRNNRKTKEKINQIDYFICSLYSMRNLSLLLILGLAITQVYCGCAYSNGYGQFSGSCYSNCVDYAKLSDAFAACDKSDSCGGVSYSYKSIGGSAATNAIGNGWGYQLRASKTGTKSPNKENSWLKSTCPDPQSPFDPCDYTQGQGVFLGGCNQNCKDFSNLNDALAACRADTTCGGVTFSRKDIGGSAATNAFDGVWGFQLRAGTTFELSPNGENAWVKSKCPVSSVQGTFCNYSKQSYQTFGNLIQAASYASESLALTACDSRSDCTGVLQSQGTFYLASGSSSVSTSNSVAYTRGACNVIANPILFSGCNFTGDQVQLTQDISKIDLSKYKSLYVPTGKYVRFYSQENFKGTANDNKNSIYCQGSGLVSAFIQKAHSNGFSFETSIQVRDLVSVNKISRKLKPNQN